MDIIDIEKSADDMVTQAKTRLAELGASDDDIYLFAKTVSSVCKLVAEAMQFVEANTGRKDLASEFLSYTAKTVSMMELLDQQEAATRGDA
jgi:hypothetical protein